MAELNERQRLFAQYYVELGVGTEAARKAGYAESGAHSTAYDLLRHELVAAEIERLKAMRDNALKDEFKRVAREMFRVVAGIATNKDASERDRLNAAKDLLDRAGHKPTEKQEIAGKDGGELTIKFVDPE